MYAAIIPCTLVAQKNGSQNNSRMTEFPRVQRVETNSIATPQKLLIGKMAATRSFDATRSGSAKLESKDRARGSATLGITVDTKKVVRFAQ